MRRLAAPLALLVLAAAAVPAEAASAVVTVELSPRNAAGAVVPLTVPAARAGDLVLVHADVTLRGSRQLVLRAIAQEGMRAYARLTPVASHARGRSRFLVDVVLTGAGDRTASAYAGGATWRRRIVRGGNGNGVARVAAQARAIALQAAARREPSSTSTEPVALAVPVDALSRPPWTCRRSAGSPGHGRVLFGRGIARAPFVGDALADLEGPDVAAGAREALCGAATTRVRTLAHALAP